ncbi:hypothetical protein F4808DRAFT_465402 [Astrocystis sublimbata]|nr:hypothetical protein F4808DRAFT_465402 [Astrocystis sublimbata]
MASRRATSEQITASDMVAIAKVNWDKLAAPAGFKDGATAKAHYEPLIRRNGPDNPPKMRQTSHVNNTAATPSKTGTYQLPSDLEDGEV